MNTETQKIPIEFAGETRFEVTIKKGVLPLNVVEAAFGKHKKRLIGRLLAENRERAFRQRLRHLVNEAEALAWATPYPTLFMQDLIEEKTRVTRVQIRRQNRIKRRSAAILVEVE